MKPKTKLFQIGGPMEDGTIRLQNQLSLGKDYASHILKDGILKVWGRSNLKGFDFIETNEPYHIVNSIEEMKYQQL